jgi:hypothetical protein
MVNLNKDMHEEPNSNQATLLCDIQDAFSLIMHPRTEVQARGGQAH